MLETFLTDWVLPYLLIIAGGGAIIKFCGWRAEVELDRKARAIQDPQYGISRGKGRRR